MKEYCAGCGFPLEEWEWSGNGICETCAEQAVDVLPPEKSQEATDNNPPESDLESWQL